MVEGPLGRREPTDWEHVDKYPLRALPPLERPEGVPSAPGVNWYPEFDSPIKGEDNRWRVKAPAKWSRPRGGHCIAVKPPRVVDSLAWWRFYNQGAEGACVGFGVSRVMSWLNRKRYDARWLYKWAQDHDEWDDTPPEEGTSVRAGLDGLRAVGHVRVRAGKAKEPNTVDGIAAFRWATTVDEWLMAIGWPGASEVPWANSWGELGYPHLVWVPVEGGIDRLMRESGEFPIIVDK